MLQTNLWRRWRQGFNLVVANSEAVKRSLMAEGIEPVKVVWNGVPIQTARPPLSSPPTVVFAGRLVREKGVDILLRAFASVVTRITEARLLIAGDGPERERLEGVVTDLGLSSNVSMLGHLSPPELDPLFNRAWVQVVPSRWAEPFGRVAAEAMMRGTAVVASNSGGLTEVVKDRKTGFLVPPGEVKPLADALLHLLQNREAAEDMGRVGRNVALADFNEVTCIDRFIELYQILVSQRAERMRVDARNSPLVPKKEA